MAPDLTAQIASLLPPPVNKGVTVTDTSPLAVAWAGVHWFSGTTRRPVADVLEVVSGLLLGAPVVQHERGARGGYSHSATCAGVFVAWGDDRPDVLVTVPGQVCEELGISGLVALSQLTEVEPSSRLDVAWDVEGIAPGLLREQWNQGNIVTRAHRDSWQWMESREGTTFYMGSRTSERFVRAYDKRGPCRIELEVKERRSVELWRRLVLLNDEDAWSLEALAELRAFVDFRDRSVSSHPAECPLLPWWAEFCQGAERRSAVLPRQAPTLEKMDAWLRRQVAPVLALVADAHGPAVLQDLMTAGRSRYRSRPDRVALLELAHLRLDVYASAAD